MSYGFEVLNTSGAVMIDASLPQSHLIDSGTVTGSGTFPANGPAGWSIPGFSRTITNPVVFVRAPINSFFSVAFVGEGGFYCVSEGNLNWAVYEGTTAAHTPSGFGLVVYNSAGQVIFDANKTIPVLLQTSLALSDADSLSYAGSPIRTVTFSGTALDGGLPFVSAASLHAHYYGFSASGGGQTYGGLMCRFISTTQIEIWSKPVLYTGFNPYLNVINHNFGQRPRSMIFIK